MKHLKLFEAVTKDKLSIKLYDEGDEWKVFHLFINKKKIGEIALEGEGVMTIIDSSIEEEYRGKGYYKEFMFMIIRKYNIKINSVFRSPEADRAWTSLIKKLPSDIKYREYKDYDKNKNYELSSK